MKPAKPCDCGEVLVDGRCPPCDVLDQKRKRGPTPAARIRRAERVAAAKRETITYEDRLRVGAKVATFDPLFAIGRGRGQKGADYRYGRGLKRKAARS